MTPDQIDIGAIVNPWQALVLVVLILGLIIWPSIAAWIQARRSASAVNDVRKTLTTSNGGSHIKDSLDRIEHRQQEQGDTLTALGQRVEALEGRRRWWGQAGRSLVRTGDRER